MKFVKAYPHKPVNFDAIAVLSSASSEGTGVRASTLLVGGGLLALLFCGLVFFAVRLRLILDFFAFRFLAMQYPLMLFHRKTEEISAASGTALR